MGVFKLTESEKYFMTEARGRNIIFIYRGSDGMPCFKGLDKNKKMALTFRSSMCWLHRCATQYDAPCRMCINVSSLKWVRYRTKKGCVWVWDRDSQKHGKRLNTTTTEITQLFLRRKT